MSPPFSPVAASTVTLAVTNSSSRVQFTSVANKRRSVRVANVGPRPIFVEFGDVTVVATTAAGVPVAPGTSEVFGIPSSVTHVAALTASGTATLYTTPGQGL